MRIALLFFMACLIAHGPVFAQDTPRSPEELIQYVRKQRLELRQTQESLRRTQGQQRAEARNTINRIGRNRVDFYEDLGDELNVFPFYDDAADIFDNQMSEITREAQRVVARTTTENTNSAVEALRQADQTLLVVANSLQQMNLSQAQPQQPTPPSAETAAPAPQPQAAVANPPPPPRQMEGAPPPVVSSPRLVSSFAPSPQSVRASTTNVSEFANPAQIAEQSDILTLPDGPIASVQRAPSPRISVAGRPSEVAQAAPAQPTQQPQSNLVGRVVRARTGETVGRIVDVLPAPDAGQAERVVIETGGFLALRDRLVAVPRDTVQSQPEGPATANLSISEIERLPGFSYEGTARAANP